MRTLALVIVCVLLVAGRARGPSCWKLRNDEIHKAGHDLYLRMKADVALQWEAAGYSIHAAAMVWCDGEG